MHRTCNTILFKNPLKKVLNGGQSVGGHGVDEATLIGATACSQLHLERSSSHWVVFLSITFSSKGILGY
jgi:hypothetical protein